MLGRTNFVFHHLQIVAFGQDAAFKKTIHDNVTSLPTPDSTSSPPGKKVRVTVEGAETINLVSTEKKRVACPCSTGQSSWGEITSRL
jgi:hypothetical protein